MLEPNSTLLRSLESSVMLGGKWSPPGCEPVHHTAVIVPYRNRSDQLNIFLQNIHPFLQRQLLHYQIFIIEQSERHRFNRAKLFNIGFQEAGSEFCCFIFHDVDLLPQNSQNIYGCSSQPRHLCASIDIFRYVLIYPELFGGVVAFTRDQFVKVNGYSNNFFGWGGEDDDLSFRLVSLGHSHCCGIG
ncbi:hypothetical protein LAZ67_4001608 [Cordylochernes scorpioides]|uniref:Beta-1,4-N-acetylgalactosaminyltransferase bre-4 n=1 Tax=Cordylochernes scorpioides TaxID=51811 RepID=A0ABY6KDY3_9ARAC|nr:hypothetical protein LAZ67_4001608 [Cordylochernes scorpioides]